MTPYEHVKKILSTPKDYRSQGFHCFNTWSQTLFQVAYEYLTDIDNIKYPVINENAEQIREDVGMLLNKGKEPAFSLGPYWHYAPICQILVLIAKKPRLFELFSKIEQEKIHQLMKMFAYDWNLGCNTNNNYGTGVDRTGNYGKWRGPNYRLANIGLIFPIMTYFETEQKLNDILLGFDYDTEMDNLRKYNFKRPLRAWSSETFYDNQGKRILGAKEMSMNGGTAYIQDSRYGITNTYWRGSGVGVRTPYHFKDKYPYGIVHFLYNNCFDGGDCKSNIQIDDTFAAHIKDNSTSPFEELDGLMLEFNMSNDGQGIRSSLFYCTVDFMLMVQLITFLQIMNITKLKDYKNLPKVWVGMEDYIYKKQHGYVGYRLGYQDMFMPNNLLGLESWIDYWKELYNPLWEIKGGIQ